MIDRAERRWRRDRPLRSTNLRAVRNADQKWRFAGVVAWLVLLGSAQASADTTLIPRRALFVDADRPVAVLSPDGERIAYIEIQDGTRTAWVAPSDDPDARTRVALLDQGQPLGLWWSADGQRLLVQQQVRDGVRLASCDASGAPTIDLTPLPGVSARLERLSGELPGQALVALNDRDPRVHDHWKIDLLTAEKVLVLERKEFRTVHFDASYRPRVAEKAGPNGTLELLRRADDDQWVPLRTLDVDRANVQRAPGAGVQGVIGVDAAGEVLYLVDNAGRDKSALLAVDLATGQETVLATDADADIRPIAVVDRVTGRALAATAQFDQLRRYVIDEAVRRDFALLEDHFHGPVGTIGISAQDRAWLVAPLDGGPVRFHVYQRSRQTVEPLFSANRVLDQYPLAPRFARVATTRDGLRLPCHVYLPPGTDANADGQPDAPLPTLLFVHGGPDAAYPWDSWLTNRCLQLLANRGYAALRVEFRGAGGFGKSFIEQGYREWGGKSQQDLVDFAHWAVDQHIAQPGKVGIWGWSFGGFSTFATAAFYPDEFACGMALYGLSDLELFARRTSLLWRDTALRVGDPRTPDGLELLRRQSPLHFAERVTSPLLVTHGGKDVVVPKQQSDLFVSALEQHGKDVTYLVYPDEGHDYFQAESWISFWAVAERFLHKHLGGSFEPTADAFEGANLQVPAGWELLPELAPFAKPKPRDS
ncbi:MAG: prolyl oligopeptidase family serine peptidase [Pirellulales bacterium]|nr:prolyl oligopeptidase family serine peptidase [Pirellulales bacterium]